MPEFFDIFTRVRELPPHGYCLLWQPELIWTHVVADALIAAAYFSIPLALIRFVTRRRDIAFGWIFWLFALFIVACGTTHLMSIWTLWNPDYGFEALIKLITAAASIGTAAVLWPLIPRALALPSPLQLRHANEALAERVRERDEALARLTAETGERRRAEAALVQAQKMDAIGQVTGGIAHDFNNLLQAMAGMLALIERHPNNADKVRDWAVHGLRAAERGGRLTGRLLAFSRVQRLDLKPVEVGATVEAMIDLLSRSLVKGVTIETELADGGAAALADKSQLELALLNLAINARDAMPEGGTLTIATNRIDHPDRVAFPDGAVEIAVRDTGIGMEPEVVERAFDPFFTTKAVGKGTGLGLSMVYGVVRQSGGTIRIDSAPGEGTSVVITLKQVPAPRAEEAARPPRASVPVGGGETIPLGGGESILVIDDDDDVRISVRQQLESLGYRVREAADGEAGLAAIADDPPDLAIVDFAMPGMTGDEVARRARALRPELGIVFASGYADREALAAAVGEDAQILRKPFRLDALAELVADALAQR